MSVNSSSTSPACS